ncbi:MAG TPA: hypothetical protein VFK39_02915 [Gemmatimonadaceae bacterium]|nr:hypothetical protein [Gemmatimonadaceae bacterium]
MNESLRDRILRRLDTLSDERGYQVLDYVEFLESKYADKTAQVPNLFQRFTEGVEDSLRAGRVSASSIAETMGLLNKAMGVLSGVAAAGKSVASDVMGAASRAGSSNPPGSAAGSSSADASSTASSSHDAAPARQTPPSPPHYTPPPPPPGPPPHSPPSPPAGPPPAHGEQRGSWPPDVPPGFGE